MEFSGMEKEVIFLKAVIELVDSMVNREIFDLLGKDPHSEISFKSMTHQQYFNIMLVDFLSLSDEKVIGERRSYLDAILAICECPHFNDNGSVDNLALTANEFNDWLEQEVQVETGMPSLQKNQVLSIRRVEFLKICGDVSKHNFSRLGSTAKKLLKILERNGIPLDVHGTLLVLDDFYERFHTDILNYHGSTIAEFLNNIRWGIHEYLEPEFSRSMVRENGDPPRYRYTYPREVTNEFAKRCYWDLMNAIRSGPFLKRFKVIRLLKRRY
jgi:hypothetical protein